MSGHPVVVTESSDLCDAGSERKADSPLVVSRTRSEQPTVNHRDMDEVNDDGGRYTAQMHRTETFKDSAGHKGTSLTAWHARGSNATPMIIIIKNKRFLVSI